MVPVELPIDVLRRILMDAGVPSEAIFIGDESLVLVEPGWIQNDLAKEWSNVRKQLGFKYILERRDCDDFARAAAYWAGEFHAQTPDSPVSGLAFGEAWCSSLKHAFNIAIHRNADGTYKVECYEPQPGASGFSFSVIPMRPVDWATISLCKF